jgi:hypothetical protein
MGRNLRSADQRVLPAVDAMTAAGDYPESDAPLLALARRLAASIDAMPDGVAAAMLPQFTGQLVKVLAELDARSRRRGTAVPRQPSRLDQLRAARAASDSRRGAH